MKNLLIALFFLAPLFSQAQVTNLNLPDCSRPFKFIVNNGVITPIVDRTITQPAGRGIALDNRALAYTSGGFCTSWHMVYSFTPGITALSLEADFALDGGNLPGAFTVWPAANVSGTMPITTATGVGKEVSFYGNPDWISAFLNSATGTGEITGGIYGWRAQGTSDTTTGATPVNPATFQFKNITTNTNTLVKATSGSLHAITVNTSAAGAVTIKDSAAPNCAGGVTIGTLTLLAQAAGTQETVFYDVTFNNGLCITTAASPDLTVSFK